MKEFNLTKEKKEALERVKNKENYGCAGCSHSSNCFFCFDCSHSSNCFFCFDLFFSSNCFFCSNCSYCSNCSNCSNKKYMISNVQFTEEEYEAWIKGELK